MKGGAAIHLSLLEEYSKDKDFKGKKCPIWDRGTGVLSHL